MEGRGRGGAEGTQKCIAAVGCGERGVRRRVLLQPPQPPGLAASWSSAALPRGATTSAALHRHVCPLQDLALGIYMPPPFDRILKRISCNQVKALFQDVKRWGGQ